MAASHDLEISINLNSLRKIKKFILKYLIFQMKVTFFIAI